SATAPARHQSGLQSPGCCLASIGANTDAIDGCRGGQICLPAKLNKTQTSVGGNPDFALVHPFAQEWPDSALDLGIVRARWAVLTISQSKQDGIFRRTKFPRS